MIRIRSITMRNFLSVGNTTQAINLDENNLTLVLGENLDQGGGGSRNGVGKTTLIQAISYALYGQPLTNIKKDNLINKTNGRNMSVSIDFEIDGKPYRIERGRKPNFMRYLVNDGLVNAPDTDEAHGESKWTQQEIERVLGMSHTLFKHVVALHTRTTPFLSLNDKQQREIIEELISITQLSEKAASLKDMIKQVKEETMGEEIRIKTVIQSNDKIQKTINDLHFQSNLWDKEHQKKVDKLQKAIDQMLEIDVDVEIEGHRISADWNKLSGEVSRLEKDLGRLHKMLTQSDISLAALAKQLESAEAHACPTCGNEIHDQQHEKILEDLMARTTSIGQEREEIEKEMGNIVPVLEAKMAELTALGERPQLVYHSMEEALNHRHTLDKLSSDIAREKALVSPYIDQIANLTTSGLQDISYDYLNELARLREHQEYLLSLLTKKDSFIRKKIIDQNLSYLNHRLNSYLERLNLPHEVVFQSDLSVAITNLGKDYDFDSLSNGEANRLVLALAWSFRDVWESMNQHLNLMMIDELVDSGMDSQGMDSALEVLKRNARERNKNIYLISHKDELVSRVGKILLVQKENGFTTFIADNGTE